MCIQLSISSLQSLDWNGGLEWWTGMVEWNGGIANLTKMRSHGHNVSGKGFKLISVTSLLTSVLI